MRAQATISRQPGVLAQAANASPHSLQIQTPQASPLLHKAEPAPPLAAGICGAPALPAAPAPAAPPLDGSALSPEPASLLAGSGAAEPEFPEGSWRTGAPASPSSLDAPPAPASSRALPPARAPPSAAGSPGSPAPPGMALATSVVHGSVSQRNEASPMPSIALQDSTPPARALSTQPRPWTAAGGIRRRNTTLMRSGSSRVPGTGHFVIAQALLPRLN